MVSNLIRRFILGVVDDSRSVQEVQTQHSADRTSDGVEMLYPYGYRAVPPSGGEGIQVSIAGQTANAVAVAVVDRANAPPTGSPEGACGLYLPGAYMVYVDPAGVLVLVGNLDGGRDATDAVPTDGRLQAELLRLNNDLDNLIAAVGAGFTAVGVGAAANGPAGKTAMDNALSGTGTPSSPNPTASTKIKIPSEGVE